MDAGNRMVAAAQLYVARKRGESRPVGRTDNGGRWYPCRGDVDDVPMPVRSPSRSWPWSYYKRCFTLPHCCAVYGVDDVSSVRKLVKRLESFA